MSSKKMDKWTKKATDRIPKRTSSNLLKKIDEWTKKETDTILKFMSLSSKDRRSVHEIATRRGFYHSSFRDPETDKKFVAVARTQEALEVLMRESEKSRAKSSFTETSETVNCMEKSQLTYGFEAYGKRLNFLAETPSDPERERVCRMANNPPSNFLKHTQKADDITSKNKSEHTFVNTKVQLQKMLEQLKRETEIAVSVKSHFVRSYYGFACLLILSTRDRMYVIDALTLRHQISSELKVLFMSPSILKVFHSAGRCVETLSRDFRIDVIHAFDTCCASRELGFKSLKLKHLLVDTCDILRDESEIQLLIDSVRLSHRVDWRFRPLSEKAMNFATIGTKYVLRLFDTLAKRLILISEKEEDDMLCPPSQDSENEELEISYCGSSSESGCDDDDDDDDDDWLDDVMEDLYVV